MLAYQEQQFILLMLEHLRNYIHKPKAATTISRSSTFCSSHSISSRKKYYFVRDPKFIKYMFEKTQNKQKGNKKKQEFKAQQQDDDKQKHIISQKIGQSNQEDKQNESQIKEIVLTTKKSHNVYNFQMLNPMNRYINQYQTLKDTQVQYTHIHSKTYQLKPESKLSGNLAQQVPFQTKKDTFPQLIIKDNFHLNLFPNLCKKPEKKSFNPQLSLSSFKSLIAVNITTLKYFQIDTKELIMQNKFLNKYSVFLMQNDHDAIQIKNIVFCLLNDNGEGSSAEHFIWNGEFFKHNQKMNLIKYIRSFIDRMNVGFEESVCCSYRQTNSSNHSSTKYKIKKCQQKQTKKQQPITVEEFFKKIWIVDMCGRTSFIEYKGLFNVIRPISEFNQQQPQYRSIFNNMKRQGQIHNSISKKKQNISKKKIKQKVKNIQHNVQSKNNGQDNKDQFFDI